MELLVMFWDGGEYRGGVYVLGGKVYCNFVRGDGFGDI